MAALVGPEKRHSDIETLLSSHQQPRSLGQPGHRNRLESTPNLKVTLPEHRAGLVKAMKQEAARAELARAIITAQQKIDSLRRSE
ncbi:hypothetical protein [Streptomyces sp. NPDC006335]|uniref:hypothetical protein n=1 Tax=Streptomyces sp. NPDC006335 TaxID=3156895 RepID=UPI0033A3A38A